MVEARLHSQAPANTHCSNPQLHQPVCIAEAWQESCGEQAWCYVYKGHLRGFDSNVAPSLKAG